MYAQKREAFSRLTPEALIILHNLGLLIYQEKDAWKWIYQSLKEQNQDSDKKINLYYIQYFITFDYYFHIVCKEYNYSIQPTRINGTCAKFV